MATKTEEKTEQKTLRFLLLRGGHSAGSRKAGDFKLYEPGDVIETTTDLATRFGRNKFRKLEDQTKGK
jgi:hypothetical protein